MRRNYSRHTRKPAALLLEALESRTLLSAIPTGAIDVLNRTNIMGWAYDADDKAGAVNIQITINGTPTTIAANTARPDLVPVVGSAYHGFSFTMPTTLAPGNATVVIKAVSPTTGASKVLKQMTLNNPAPTGWIDIKSGTRIAGWAYDTDSTSPIQIEIDVDGAAGTPFATNVARPDIAGKARFATAGFDVSGNYAGHVVEVFAIDAPSGVKTLLYTNNHPPTGWVDVSDGYTIKGWAQDPDNPTASINVITKIDGITLGTTTLAGDSRPDLVNALGSANHGFTVTIPGLNPGTHNISVYAVDGQASSAAPVLISSKTITNRPPVGHIDVVNSNIIKGWALDPDLGATPTTVSIYVDDLLFQTVTANQSRPDLTRGYGSPNHGFTVDLSSLPAGSHSITVTAKDNRTSDEDDVVIYDDFINNTQPRGVVDTISENTIYGWAQDPDAPTTAIPVDIYIDGVYNKTTTANVNRPDLTSAIGSANHGFSVTLPEMTFGTHRIDVYASESQGNVSTLIGAKTVTNRPPVGMIDLANSTTLAGWIADADTPTQSLDFKVFINGVEAASGTANVTRNDLTPTLGSANHGFWITLPTLSSGRNQIDLYAVDKNNGLLSYIKSAVIVV
jgi:hypothetical protein